MNAQKSDRLGGTSSEAAKVSKRYVITLTLHFTTFYCEKQGGNTK